MNILGDTLQLIAAEKAGIIKPNVPVIIGEKQDEVADIFIRKAEQENAVISFASDLFNSKVKSQKSKGWNDLLEVEITENSPLTTHHLQLDLTGSYQLKNIKTVFATINELRTQGFIITDDHIKTALRQVKTLTGLHGRWEVLSTNPLTICDTGHNPDGIQEVLKNIANVQYNQLHFVIGMVNDKDSSKVLSMLPTNAIYYFCQPNMPRRLEAESLKQKAESFGLVGQTYSSVKDAFASAQKNAKDNDLIFVGGSTFVVAEIV
jgi:dihydrofolate synthase/folylpolyglutamate synthase